MRPMFLMRATVSCFFLTVLLRLKNAIATEDGSSLWAISYEFDSFDFPGSQTWSDTAGDSDVDPCQGWAHVTCNSEGRIVKLDLSNLGIGGPLHKFIGSLTALQELNLHGNLFRGALPLTLGLLTNLTFLDLGNNLFTGTIPPQIGTLTNLTNLNLANNSLTGTVPPALQSKFCYTYFENNPATINLSPSSFPNCTRAAFVSSPPPPLATAKKSSDLKVILGASIGGAAALLLIVAIILFIVIRRNMSRSDDEDEKFILTEEELMEIESGLDKMNLAHIRRFTVEELEVATKDWTEEVGSGGSAVVYKGEIQTEDGAVKAVAVKRMKSERVSKESLVDFCNEIDLISRAVHRNVMRLEGFCVSAEERVLVFPFMPFGSVQDHLRGQRLHQKNPLSLSARRDIAIGAARGLAYLHDECSAKIIHRDVKAANVLLTPKLDAVVTDFGLAKLVKNNEKATKIAGTFGHIAPEYLISGRLSDKADVYAFGVFLLEITTGLHAGTLAEKPNPGEGIREWLIRMLDEGRIAEVIDIELRAKYLEIEDDSGVYKLEELVTIVQVAIICMISNPEVRPTMSEVLRLLQGEGLAEARQKIMEDVPESVLNWNPGYGQFTSLSQSMMSFITEEEGGYSGVDLVAESLPR